VTSRTGVLDVLKNIKASGKKYITKDTAVEDATRGDMTLLPLESLADMKAYLSRLDISEKRPWILQ
jgi:hypothetical protein